MRVGARPPEPAHAGGRGLVVADRPGRRLGRDPQRQPVPVHIRIRSPEVQVPRDDPVLHRQDGLDDARDARRRFQVPDVGLHRADQQGPLRVASPAVRRRRRLQLDGVADRGPGAVRFQVVHPGGLDAGSRERRLDALLLRRPARHRQARARPVLVERGAADHAPDPVPVGLRLVEPLEHHDAAAFAPHVAVRGRVEGRAPPVRRQHSGVRAQLQQPSGQDGMDAAREREVRLAPLKPRHRLVHGHQRRRAGGVYRHRRALQAQCVGHPPDGGVEGGAGDSVEAGGGLGRLADLQYEVAVLVVADPRVDPGAAPPQPFRVHAGVLERPPAGLQHQPLLRVEELRLDRGDAEERGVELVESVEVGAEPAGDALHVAIREQLSDAADAGAGLAFLHRVHPVVEQAPEGGDAVRAGESAGHADDGDRLLSREMVTAAIVRIAERILPRTSVSGVHRCSSVCMRMFRGRHLHPGIAVPSTLVSGTTHPISCQESRSNIEFLSTQQGNTIKGAVCPRDRQPATWSWPRYSATSSMWWRRFSAVRGRAPRRHHGRGSRPPPSAGGCDMRSCFAPLAGGGLGARHTSYRRAGGRAASGLAHARNRPWPGRPRNSSSAQTTSPRESVTAGQPLIRIPS